MQGGSQRARSALNVVADGDISARHAKTAIVNGGLRAWPRGEAVLLTGAGRVDAVSAPAPVEKPSSPWVLVVPLGLLVLVLWLINSWGVIPD